MGSQHRTREGNSWVLAWRRELWWATRRHETVIDFLRTHKNYRAELPRFEELLERNCLLWERAQAVSNKDNKEYRFEKTFVQQPKKQDKLSNESTEKKRKEKKTFLKMITQVSDPAEKEKVTGREERKIMLRRKSQGTRGKQENCKHK